MATAKPRVPGRILTLVGRAVTLCVPPAPLAPLPTPRLRTVLKKLGISLLSLLLFGVIAEMVARAAEPGPFSLFDRYPYQEVDGATEWRHIPGFEGRWDSTWYAIDERGLRGRTAEPTFADGERRILCVGDSCTFGKGVLEEDCWPRQLETRMRAAGADAKVFNLGVNGTYGQVYLELLEQHVPDLKPEAVVVGYNLNDFPNSLRKIDEAVFQERGLRKLIPQGTRDSLGRLALYRFARAAYYDSQRDRDLAASEALAETAAAAPIDDEVWARERATLAAIRDLCQEHGARPLVFLFPYESQVLLEEYDRGPIERLSALCEELGVSFVDLTTTFRAEARATDPMTGLFIKGDRYHPNPLGYGIVAREVAGLLGEQ